MTALHKIFLSLFAALCLATTAAAGPITLTPADADFDGNSGAGNYGPSNCEPGCINDLFGTSFTNADLLYKADFGNANDGQFASSYSMDWAGDPNGGLLSFVGGPSINCLTCYLAVKDGNHDPRYYFYDISTWDGTSDITLSGFWAQKGAISHASIWGTTGITVPEPGTMAMLLTGLAGLLVTRRRRAS